MTALKILNAKRLAFLILPIVFTIGSSFAPASDLRTVAVLMIWITGLFYAVPALAMPIRLLRRVPSILWLLWLVAFITILVIWIVRFQPAVGLPISLTEQLWLWAGSITLTLLPVAGRISNEKARIGWLAGPLITITTLIFIIIGLEFGLRYLWVMSDNFQFSKMHQNWNRLYWHPINEAGYRDYAVPTSNDDRQNILIMGDSLVTGYGINTIADTFPHILGDMLGTDYTVNIVAQPGWGVASSFGALQAYPIVPDLVILSHYINDINEGTAAQQYGRPFPQIRVEPTDTQRWWTDRFYIANFLYYRVFLYTQYDSLGLYNEWVYGAYTDSQVWQAYQTELQTVIDWTEETDIELIVLAWSDLINIEQSQVITQPVIDFFETQSISVINMGQYIADLPLNQRTVNPFDAHPSVMSHRLAAEQIAQVLSE